MRRLLVILLTIGGALFGVPSVAGAAEADYVALGDSYAAGLGTRTYDASSGSCKRSPKAYPPLYSSRVVFVACSGATTSGVLSQADAVAASTSLVTLTVGGNDVGFSSVVTTCTIGSDAQCVSAVDDAIGRAGTVLPGKLDEVLAKIGNRAAPSARVVVLGYPHLFEERAFCLGQLSLTKRRKLNVGSDELDAVIKARTEFAGATFVDVRGRFSGHGLCSAAPWVNGLTLPSSESYHPNVTGQANGYLPALQAAVSTASAA